MKKAFTLSETLISLAIIGVISAILIPVLNNVRPDKERVLYKKALYSIQNAIATAINDNTSSPAGNSSAFWADTVPNENGQLPDFCNDVASTLNLVGPPNCSAAGSYDQPNFVTVNGTKWWGLGGSRFTLTGDGREKIIKVDVTGNSVTSDDEALRIKVRYDGRVTTDGNWSTENDYLSDALKVTKGDSDNTTN